jgi:putative transcriptional regulator
MIKHHPKFELLQNFVNGDLPASLSAGIAIHADMCAQCQEKINQLTEQVAEASFEQNFLHKFVVDDEDDMAELAELDFDSIIDEITASDDIEPVTIHNDEKSIEFKGCQYVLPKAIRNIVLGKTAQIGKLSRTRLQLDEGEIHTSLLHIDPGGSVPEHTHNGFELTLLLAGSFTDKQGEYNAGDFIMLDKRHQHHPVSEHGCLCYTVANDSLHFTQGINKLLNPIGSFIY